MTGQWHYVCIHLHRSQHRQSSWDRGCGQHRSRCSRQQHAVTSTGTVASTTTVSEAEAAVSTLASNTTVAVNTSTGTVVNTCIVATNAARNETTDAYSAVANAVTSIVFEFVATGSTVATIAASDTALASIGTVSTAHTCAALYILTNRPSLMALI